MQAFLLKYLADGTLEWAVPVSFSFFSNVTGLALGPDGCPVLGMDIGYGTAVAGVAKFSSDGETLWTRSFPASAISGVAVSGNGDVFGFGTKGNPIQDSVWVARISTGGSLLWLRSYRLGAAHQVHGFGVDSAGHSMALLRVSSNGDRPAGPTIMKFGTNGETLWVKTYSSIPNPVSMTVAPSGVAFVLDASSVKKVRSDGSVAWSAGVPSGALASDVGFDDAENVFVAYTDNRPDIRVRKYDAQGSPQWTMGCVRPGQDQAMTVTTDVFRRPVVSGLTVEPDMRVITVKFVSVPGLTEQSCVSLDRVSATTAIASGEFECRVVRAGRYLLTLFDECGRLTSPPLILDLTEGRNRVRLPKFSSGVCFAVLRGEGIVGLIRVVHMK